MSAYHSFTVRAAPDLVALLATVRAACGDASAGIGGLFPVYTVKKATEWTAPQIAATEAAFEVAVALTPQRQAQNEIDKWPLSLKALVLALIDRLNVLSQEIVELRQATGLPQTPALSDVTPAQALSAIRAKAATL